MAVLLRPFSSSMPKVVIWKNFSFYPALQRAYDIDKIDCFTSDLVREKTIKWKCIKENLTNSKYNTRNHSVPLQILIQGLMTDFEHIDSLKSTELDITLLTVDQLNSLFRATIKSSNQTDFNYLVEECIKKKVLPDLEVVLTFLSTNGHIETIILLNDLHTELFAKENPIFRLHKAYALWKRGNADSAFRNFATFYEHPDAISNRRAMYRMFRTISSETINGKGEAILFSLVNFAKHIHLNYNDLLLLALVWKVTFESNWFSDQNLSDSILEENQYLRDEVGKSATTLCAEFLRVSNTEAVYRLIEQFLKYDMADAYENCLKSLFDYYYYRRNCRACSEILKTLKTLNIEIAPMYNEKLINLLINQNINYHSIQRIPKQHTVQYKF